MDRHDCRLEVKFADGAPDGAFSGYGAVFGNADAYGDVITRGAFRDSLREWKKAKALPPLLLQHGGWGIGADDLMPVGIWTDMAEDEHGLKVEGRLALGTQRGREAYELLKLDRPALDGLSIGYRAKEFVVGTKPDEPRRTLKKIDLVEVSLVTFPANDKARVQAVKAIDAIGTLSDAEAILRDAGFSRREAVALVSRIKAVARGEPAAAGLDDIAALLKRNAAILTR